MTDDGPDRVIAGLTLAAGASFLTGVLLFAQWLLAGR